MFVQVCSAQSSCPSFFSDFLNVLPRGGREVREGKGMCEGEVGAGMGYEE